MVWTLLAILAQAELGGTVRIEPPFPKPRVDKAILSDPKCAECWSAEPLKDDLVHDEKGGLKNAFVAITKGLEGLAFPPAEGAVVLAQKGCRYVPRVLGVRTGQGLQIQNNDGFLHNLHLKSFVNPNFNQAQAPGIPVVKVFKEPELMMPLRCDLHPWMVSWIGVVDHPFFAVTAEDGRFSLKGLPAGSYTLSVWHERMEKRSLEVTVPAKEPLDLVLKLRP